MRKSKKTKAFEEYRAWQKAAQEKLDAADRATWSGHVMNLRAGESNKDPSIKH